MDVAQMDRAFGCSLLDFVGAGMTIHCGGCKGMSALVGQFGVCRAIQVMVLLGHDLQGGVAFMTWSSAGLLQSSTAVYSTEHMLPAGGCTPSVQAIMLV